MAAHFNILAWKIPWTEEPGSLQSPSVTKFGQDWSDLACTHLYYKLFQHFLYKNILFFHGFLVFNWFNFPPAFSFCSKMPDQCLPGVLMIKEHICISKTDMMAGEPSDPQYCCLKICWPAPKYKKTNYKIPLKESGQLFATSITRIDDMSPNWPFDNSK